MKPLSLTLSGFRSHLEETEISFDGRTLTAIVGPTGAGKSTILEAITFALYGKTPRGDQRSTTQLICSRCDTARVLLRFLVDDRECEITRVISRRGGKGQHLLVEPERDQPISGDRAVTERVVELLGLSFEAFCSSVLLAQGQFSKFLQSTPGDRDKILKGVFRLHQIDQLQEAAKERRRSVELDLSGLEGERRQIPDDVAGLLKEARRQMRDAAARASVLERALPRERELEDRSRAARALADEQHALVERLATAASKIPAATEFDALDRAEASFLAELQQAEGALQHATSEYESARAKHEELEKELGGELALGEARSKADQRKRTLTTSDALALELEAQREALERLKKQALEAEDQATNASKLVDEILEQRRALERAHQAHVLKASLVPGEKCPVCEQNVDAPPAASAPAELTEIEEEERRLRQAAERARGQQQRAAAALTTSQATLDARASALDAERRQLAALDAELARFGNGSADPLDEIRARLDKLHASKARAEHSQQARDAARTELEARRAEGEGLTRRRHKLAAALIEVATDAGIGPPSVDTDAATLSRVAADARRGLESAARSASAERDEATRQQSEIEVQLVELRATVGVTSEKTIADLFAEARSAEEVAKSRGDELEKQQTRLKEIERQSKELQGRYALFDELAKDLGPKFIAFLLEERTRFLLELASDRLHTMTGRYHLELDERNDLQVIDELDADKRRSVDTLSGGETFLASLALALALAELVTRSGGRLQCFFLDEGFGTLDPESFDLALDGIERIVTTERLIGLVSHVPALRDRIEDQIVLEKGDDGMTRVAAGRSL